MYRLDGEFMEQWDLEGPKAVVFQVYLEGDV